MMTAQQRNLLSAADPWGCECGGLGGLGDFADDALEAAGSTGIGTGVQTVGKEGGATLNAIKTADFNGITQGAVKTFDAAKDLLSDLDTGWNDAKKFFVSIGGNVSVPSIGYKEQPGKPNTLPPIIPGYFSAADVQGKLRLNVYNATKFLDGVSKGYVFSNQDWTRFGLQNPITPPSQAVMDLFMQQRLVWNPFKNQWQGATPGQTITPQSPTPTSPTGVVLSGAAVKENDQAWVNAMGSATTGFDMQLKWVRDQYLAGRWKKAINGTTMAAPGAGGILKLGANGLIGVMGRPFPWVVRAITEGLTFTTGPLVGKPFKATRVTWVRQLARLLAKQPQSRRPANLGFLVTATDTGMSEGKPIIGAGALRGGRGGGGGMAVAAVGGLGLLWLLFA